MKSETIRVRRFKELSRVGSGALLLTLMLFGSVAAHGQWAAGAGETVRDAFGPAKANGATVCRGACGSGCPSTCSTSEVYECLDGLQLRRVRTYACGTHAGCREHDDCLDRCQQQRAAGFDCQASCHSEAIQRYGLEVATSWASGGGPYDGEPITFEYTIDAPGEPQPAFRCPEGAMRECSGSRGVCRAGNGTVEPVFDAYQGTGGMRISSFRSGLLCGDGVCGQAVDIQVTGEDSCAGENCTRYGVEFDYDNADPSAPLDCSTSTSGSDDDFIGGLIKKGFDSAPELDGDTFEGNSGLGELLGMFQKVVQSADSPEDVKFSIAPLGPDGKPIESQRVGTQPTEGPAPVPDTVDLPSASGHLLVPMYEVANGTGETKTKQVRCSHKGEPVFEATFRLHE